MIPSSTSTASFPFHCVICVERFNTVDRVPVVLPCGHTYICEQCSRRIDKCMECRMSLFIEQPQQQSSQDLMSKDTTIASHTSLSFDRKTSVDHRYNFFNYGWGTEDGDENDYPPPPSPASTGSGSVSGSPLSRREAKQIRLLSTRYGSRSPSRPGIARKQMRPALVRATTPRNVVLLELMSAAADQCRYSTSNKYVPPLQQEGGDSSIFLMDDGSTIASAALDCEGDNELSDLNAIEVLVSSCGTYAVREKAGLQVHPISVLDKEDMDMDDHSVMTQSSTQGSKSKRGFRLRKKSGDFFHRFRPQSTRPSTLLKYGQKVQIANVKDGVYRLARNRGVIFANTTQLVKVEMAHESACKVEGMIHALQPTKSKLFRHLQAINNTETNLRTNLSILLSQPEDYAVISKLPEGENDEEDPARSIESNDSSRSRMDQVKNPNLKPPRQQSSLHGEKIKNEKKGGAKAAKYLSKLFPSSQGSSLGTTSTLESSSQDI